MERTSSPLQYGDLFRSLDTLVTSIDADALGTVIGELATGLDGRGDDIRRIVQGSRDLTATIEANGDELEHLVDGVAELARVLADNRDALGSGIESLAELSATFEEIRPSAEAFVDEGPSTIALLNRIVDASDHAVICTVDGLAVLDAVLDAEAVQSLTDVLQRSAAFADVLRLVQDPEDGIFRLFISPSGGSPQTVEYLESVPLPAVPEVQSCPDDVSFSAELAGDADGAAPGTGGERPGADGTASLEEPDPETPDEQATGTSDQAAGRSLFARLASKAWLVVVAALVAGLAWLIASRLRRKS